jgi:hypothetical protein
MPNQSFAASVKLFEWGKGWYCVSVPSKLSQPLEHLAARGLIAITASVGKTSWPTSLLPMGNGTHGLTRILHRGRVFASLFRGKSLVSWQIQFVPGKNTATVKYPG